jgi:hypothetical protein
VTTEIFTIGMLTACKDAPLNDSRSVSDPADDPSLQSTNACPGNGKGRSFLHTQRQAMTWIREQAQASFSAYADAVWVVALISLAEHTHAPFSPAVIRTPEKRNPG